MVLCDLRSVSEEAASARFACEGTTYRSNTEVKGNTTEREKRSTTVSVNIAKLHETLELR